MKEEITNLAEIIGKDENEGYLAKNFVDTVIIPQGHGLYTVNIPHYPPERWHLPSPDSLALALIEISLQHKISDSSFMSNVEICPKKAILSSPVNVEIEEHGGIYTFKITGKGKGNEEGLIAGSIAIADNDTPKLYGDACYDYVQNKLRSSYIHTESIDYDHSLEECTTWSILGSKPSDVPTGVIDILRMSWCPAQVLLAKSVGLKRSEVQFTWLNSINFRKIENSHIFNNRVRLETRIVDTELLHYGNSRSPYLEVGYQILVFGGNAKNNSYLCNKQLSIPLKALSSERLADFSKYDKGRTRFA